MRLNRASRFIRSTQRGIAMLDLSMTLIVLAAIAAANLSAKVLAEKLQSAERQGSSLGELSRAGETYTQEFFTELQNGLNIQKNAGTLVAGSATGQTMAPTVENLIDFGYLHQGFSAEASYVQRGIPGKYLYKIYKTGTNCVADPATCILDGYVYIDKPVTGPGGVDMDGPALGAMLNKLGNKGCISLLNNPSVMVGLDGDCGIDNPLPGNPAGAVLVRFGFGSSGFANFVRNHDTRDIELLGNLAVSKTAKADMFMTDEKILGSACTTNNAIASGSGSWLVCVSNQWQAMGGMTSSPGSTCSPDGKVATSNINGEQLICKNGVFMKTNSLLARTVLIERKTVRDDDIVQKPVCDSNGTPNRSFSITQSVVDITQNPPKQTMHVTTLDGGTYWQVQVKVKDDTGIEYSGNGYDISQTINLECSY